MPSQEELNSANQRITVGPGLKIMNPSNDGSGSSNNLLVTQRGILRKREPHIYWIDTHCKRYVPVENDRVIGVVTQKHAESWKLDICSADLANLHYLGFENVTKRNKPTFKEGIPALKRIQRALKINFAVLRYCCIYQNTDRYQRHGTRIDLYGNRWQNPRIRTLTRWWIRF